MSYMREIPYLLTGHYVAIAMRPITFPATKAEIIEKVGGEPIPHLPRRLHPLPGAAGEGAPRRIFLRRGILLRVQRELMKEGGSIHE